MEKALVPLIHNTFSWHPSRVKTLSYLRLVFVAFAFCFRLGHLQSKLSKIPFKSTLKAYAYSIFTLGLSSFAYIFTKSPQASFLLKALFKPPNLFS